VYVRLFIEVSGHVYVYLYLYCISKKKLNGAERPREGGISRADATSTYHNRIKIFWTK
jgi:hypothetical protein